MEEGIMIHIHQQIKQSDDSMRFVRMTVTHGYRTTSFWLLRDAYVNEEAVTGNVREVRREHEGGRGRWRPTLCLRMDGRLNGWREWEGEDKQRHFHQDYPPAQNLIWESSPVLTDHTNAHTDTHRHNAAGGCKNWKSYTSPQFAQESPSLKLLATRPSRNVAGCCDCVCVCAQVIFLLSSLNLSGFPPTWFYCLFIVYLQTPAHPRCTAARRKALIAACCFVFCSYTWKLEARGLIKKVLRSCT